ncbi:MAG: N-6 DNA methylase, partial [Candidatus Woesearchaeota archaeon]|nr:N-6 DNA methylase [Candidatus Woesearchaeota archaeon]
MLEAELKSKINQLWDKFWSGGISDPLQAIVQMSYLIFMKRLEDEDGLRRQNAKLSGEKFVSLFAGHEDCKWSVWTEYSGEKMLSHVRDKVFPFLRNLGGEDTLYSEYMKDAVFIIPTPSLLVEAVKIINNMHIKEQNRDTKGDLYEYLLSELKTSGKNGQFRTPRHIIKMMVELANPRIGQTVCDPACGTAGFLIAAYEHILKTNTTKELIKKDNEGNEYNFAGDRLSKIQWTLLKETTLFGFDIDQTMVRISLMNLMMHGISQPKIKQLDTLSTRFSESNYYDVVLANPPFTGNVSESELSKEFRASTTKTEILFLELFYRLLNNGGRAAVIVPNGILFGSSNAHKKIRELLIEKCKLEAVISMPSGVFKPYSGVGTAVLVFKKNSKTDDVWFYDMKSDGRTLDDKRTEIGDGKGDIPDIIEKFKNKAVSENSILVPKQKIIDKEYNLSISQYQEI